MAQLIPTMALKIDTSGAVKNIKKLNDEFKLTSTNLDSVNKSVNGTADAINNTTKSTESLKAQLRAMTQELQGLEPGTDRFNQLNTAAGKLKDQINDTNAAINATAGSVVENLAGAMTNVAGIGISAFQGIAGAQAMFGSDSEELMKLMAKLQGAMALGQALKDLGGLGDTLTNIKAQLASATVGSQLFNKATVAQAVATGTATTAQKIMNAVMNANPIFLIIGGITALVGAFALFSGASQNAAEDTENLNAALDKQAESIERAHKNATLYYDSKAKASQLEFAKDRMVIEQKIALLELIPEKTAAQNAQLKALRTELYNFNKEVLNKEVNIANKAALREMGLNEDLLKNKKEQLKNEETLSKQAIKDGDGLLHQATQERISILEDEINDIEVIVSDGDSKRLNTIEEFKNKAIALNNERALELKQIQIKEQQESLKRIEEYNNKLIAYYEAIESDRQSNIKDSREKELQDASNNFDNLTTLADAAGQSTVEITKNYQKQIAEINAKYDLEESNNKKKTLADIALLQEEILLQEQLNLADSEEQKVLIRNQHYAKLLDLQTKQIETERDVLLTNTELTEEERQKIIAESNLKIAQLNQKQTEESVEKQRMTFKEMFIKVGESWSSDWAIILSRIADFTVEIGTQITGMLGELFSQLNDQATYAVQEDSRIRTEALDDELLNRYITEEQYKRKIDLLDDQRLQKERAIKKKQFNQDKALRITNAIMLGAQAVMAALATVPPASYIMAGINAGLAGAQIAIISSQQFTAARGGVVPGMASKVDSVDAKLAPGEMVINSNSSSMFPTLLSEINKAGGGISLAPDPIVSMMGGRSNNVYTQNETVLTAVVVESQMSSTQKRVRRMEDSSSFS